MTNADKLHKSEFHREGFDPSCPKCLKDEGIPGIVRHLKACERLNLEDKAWALVSEQKRIIGVLTLYRKVQN